MRVRLIVALLVLSSAALSAIAVVAFGPAALGPAPADAQAAAYKYTGAASCGASNCHGSTKPKPDYPKLNENVLWFQKDKHAKAYETLTNEKLKSRVSPSKIAKGLNIAKAETSDRCLVCHAVNVKPEVRGPKFDITEGVHCDACHGPAEKWLEPHAEKGWTHEKSVQVGMYDTKNPLLRAEKCVSCHLAIDADMVAAGHPDLLAFELETFSGSMPPHWRDKGTWTGTRMWSVGQVVSLREAAKQLADRSKGGGSATLREEAYGKVRGHGAVVRHVLAIAAPEVGKNAVQDLATLAEAFDKGASDLAKVNATAASLAKSMTAVAGRVAGREFDGAATRKLMDDIAGDAEGLSTGGVRAAEQAAMALDRLYATWSKAPGNKSDKSAGAALDKLFAHIDDPKKFDAKAFAADLQAFQRALGK